MVKTACDLNSEERRAYQPDEAISRREARGDKRVEARWRQAHGLARRAARLLREEFGAEKVLLFGSLVHRAWFTPWSDIDLGAWGIAPDRFYAAVAAMTDLHPSIRIDLIDPVHCSPALRATIEREGREL